MARNPLHVGCSPLTKTIYAGSLVGKDGRTWASNRTDVTMEALVAVVEHVGDGCVLTLESADGSHSYQIEVRKVDLSHPRPSKTEGA